MNYKNELEVQTGLLSLIQNELNIVQNTITGLDITIIGLEANLTGIGTAIGERNRALGKRDAARNRLTIEPSSTSSQPSTKYDMAAVGYINTVGIDPLDDAGAPPGRVAAANGGAGCSRRTFRALVIPEGAGGPNIGTYVPGSDVATYAGIAANAGLTIGATFFPSRADIV
ncbi:unnamed protein product [Rhizophagus irregularis]|nr:unnamed protein product [Rhizophagus irregularis]